MSVFADLKAGPDTSGQCVVPFDDLVGLYPSEVSAGSAIQVRAPRSGWHGTGTIIEIDYSNRRLIVEVHKVELG